MKATRLAPLLAVVLIIAAFTPAASAHTVNEETTISVGSGGNAFIVQTITYDLTNETGQAKFERLSTNQTAKDEYKTKFDEELKGYAEQRGQDPSVIGTVQMQTREERDSNTGVIIIAVGWQGFAEVKNDGRVIVDNPLPAEFSPDMKTSLEAPREYEITSTENIGDAQINENTALVWQQNPSFENLNVVFQPTDRSSTTEQQPSETTNLPETTDNSSNGVSVPGFGVLSALLALAGVTLHRIRH